MSHMTKQERIGLDELFTAIEKHRYHSRLKGLGHWMKATHKQQKRFMANFFKALRH